MRKKKMQYNPIGNAQKELQNDPIRNASLYPLQINNFRVILDKKFQTVLDRCITVAKCKSVRKNKFDLLANLDHNENENPNKLNQRHSTRENNV